MYIHSSPPPLAENFLFHHYLQLVIMHPLAARTTQQTNEIIMPYIHSLRTPRPSSLSLSRRVCRLLESVKGQKRILK